MLLLKNRALKLWEEMVREIATHRFNYFILALILTGAFFVRVYRTEDLLRFYYDQGRDALAIWKFWNEWDLFFIGPVTGLTGIFLGPLYYYLIAPFYLLGGGNPVYPAVFLAFTTTLAVFFLYLLGWKMYTRATGVFAALIASFSYYLVLAGRWLSNPTPILLVSTILLWAMWKIATKEQKLNWGWIVITVTISMALQFEAASAVFYIPMILVFSLWQFKKLPNKSTVGICIGIFLLFLLPQIAFNFKNDNLLLTNFKRVLLEEKSFRPDILGILETRLNYFWGVFSSKLFPGWDKYAVLFTLLSVVVLLSSRNTLNTKILPLFLIYLGIPMIGYVFFQGNYGNIYDYYMTGYYLPMVLLFSIGLGILWETNNGKIAVLAFFIAFFMLNGELVKNLLRSGVDGPTHISLGNELQAVDWVFADAKNKNLRQYNVDVYVPPVIPYSYDYLFLWRGTRMCGENLCGLVKEPQLPIVYVVYEVDPPHPERLFNWFSKYEGSTIKEEEVKFGGVTVERRLRLSN